MAKPLRIEYEGAFYHVTSRGNEGRRIYFEKTDYEKFKEYMAAAEKKYGVVLHCYVLMSNHYHLLLETPEGNLSMVMHYINGAYTTYINIKRKRVGHLFQGRYKSIVIDKEAYLLELSRYIHLNPVRAGIVKKPEYFSYSSYKSYVSDYKDDIVTQYLILGILSNVKEESKKKYKLYVESVAGGELVSPLKDVQGGIFLGGEQFIIDILSKGNKDSLNNKEVSHRRSLKTAFQMEYILATLSKQFKKSKDAILSDSSGDLRKISIYMIKKFTGLTNKQIGELFGGISYSAVVKIYQRFSQQLRSNKEMREKVKKIENEMSYVKA